MTSPGGESAPPRLPVGLNVDQRPVLIIGGGEVAERRARRLLECGARVTVIAPEGTPEISRLACERQIEWQKRSARQEDVDGFGLVILATDVEQVNRSIAEAAHRAGAWVNRADRPGEGDFVVPMAWSRGGITVAVLGGSLSPALTRWVGRRLEETLGPEFEAFAELVGIARTRVLSNPHLSQPARADLIRRVTEGDLFDTLVRDGRAAAERLLEQLLREEGEPEQT